MQGTFLINRKKKIESFKIYFLPWKHVSKREKQCFITILLFFLHWKLEHTFNLYQKTIVKIFKYMNSVTKENSGKSVKGCGIKQVSVLISSAFSKPVKVIYYAFGAGERESWIEYLPYFLPSLLRYSVLVNYDFKVFISSSILLSHYYVTDSRLCIWYTLLSCHSGTSKYFATPRTV